MAKLSVARRSHPNLVQYLLLLKCANDLFNLKRPCQIKADRPLPNLSLLLFRLANRKALAYN